MTKEPIPGQNPLPALRRQAGFRNKELAALLGVSPWTVRAWMSNSLSKHFRRAPRYVGAFLDAVALLKRNASAWEGELSKKDSGKIAEKLGSKLQA